MKFSDKETDMTRRRGCRRRRRSRRGRCGANIALGG
jgi:hypothetical protein